MPVFNVAKDYVKPAKRKRWKIPYVISESKVLITILWRGELIGG